jgi:hypothetical protein
LCYVSNNNDSIDKAKKHANYRAGENYTGAFCYFLQALIYDFGHGIGNA